MNWESAADAASGFTEKVHENDCAAFGSGPGEGDGVLIVLPRRMCVPRGSPDCPVVHQSVTLSTLLRVVKQGAGHVHALERGSVLWLYNRCLQRFLRG